MDPGNIKLQFKKVNPTYDIVNITINKINLSNSFSSFLGGVSIFLIYEHIVEDILLVLHARYLRFLSIDLYDYQLLLVSYVWVHSSPLFEGY